jgi:uncharacterized protein YcbX
MDDINWFGKLEVPILGIRMEQLILVLYPTLIILVGWPLLRQHRAHRESRIIPPGYQKLGMNGRSNLADETEEKYFIEQGQKTDEAEWRIKSLWVHPIKSCAGIEVDEMAIEASGPIWDRNFVFAEKLQEGESRADEPVWTFRTMRAQGYDKLAMVKPEVWLKKSANKSGDEDAEVDGLLLVKYPNVNRSALAPLHNLASNLGIISSYAYFAVPLIPRPEHGCPIEQVKLWQNQPRWYNYGKYLPKDFRRFLDAKGEVTLFRVGPENYRQLFRNAPKADEVGYQPVVGAQDSYPLHLMNLSSVREVGSRLGNANPPIPNLTARRFRANLIMTGPAAYDEDDWRRISVGGNELFCSCRTTRCKLPCVDPDTGFRHPLDPYKTLYSYRRIDEGNPNSSCLGLQLTPPSDKRFVVRVGDKVEVLERGEHFFLKE